MITMVRLNVKMSYVDILYGECHQLFVKIRNIVNHAYRIKRCYVHERSGGRLNKKDGLTRYGDSHVKDKTS